MILQEVEKELPTDVIQRIRLSGGCAPLPQPVYDVEKGGAVFKRVTHQGGHPCDYVRRWEQRTWNRIFTDFRLFCE
jgi:hypothetical protein